MSFPSCETCGAPNSASCLCCSPEHIQPEAPPSTPTSDWNFPSQSLQFSSTSTLTPRYTPPRGIPGPSSASPSTSCQSHSEPPAFYHPYPFYSQPSNTFYSNHPPAAYSAPPSHLHGPGPPLTSASPPHINPALFHDLTAFVVNSNGKWSIISPAIQVGSKRVRGVSSHGHGRGGRGGQPPSIIGSSTPGAAAFAPVDTTSTATTAHRSPAPLPHFGSLVQKNCSTGAGSCTQSPASDVWYHLYGLPPGSQDAPLGRPDDQPHMYDKPSGEKYEFVACRLCRDKWRTWKCQNGQTGTLREHFCAHHFEEWRESIIQNRLKGWQALAYKQSPSDNSSVSDPTLSFNEPPEPFTVKGLGHRIARWIAADDQAINVIENELFREVIRYATTCPYALQDKDIPHCTHMHGIIVDEYQCKLTKLREVLKSALGRVSFTSDMWTCTILRGYMAVTVHFCVKNAAGQLELRSRLGAFRYIPGHHTGANMAEQFVTVLEELGILDKIGCITLDNASNCETMMGDLECILAARGIEFSWDGNRLRCFPHVVNIAVKHGLKALTSVSAAPMSISSSTMLSQSTPSLASRPPPTVTPQEPTTEEREESLLLRRIVETDAIFNTTDAAYNCHERPVWRLPRRLHFLF